MDGHQSEVEAPSGDHHRRDQATWSAEGRQKVHCCWRGREEDLGEDLDREGDRIEERYCWLACEGDPVPAEGAFDGVQGSWDEGPDRS